MRIVQFNLEDSALRGYVANFVNKLFMGKTVTIALVSRRQTWIQQMQMTFPPSRFVPREISLSSGWPPLNPSIEDTSGEYQAIFTVLEKLDVLIRGLTKWHEQLQNRLDVQHAKHLREVHELNIRAGDTQPHTPNRQTIQQKRDNANRRMLRTKNRFVSLALSVGNIYRRLVAYRTAAEDRRKKLDVLFRLTQRRLGPPPPPPLSTVSMDEYLSIVRQSTSALRARRREREERKRRNPPNVQLPQWGSGTIYFTISSHRRPENRLRGNRPNRLSVIQML